MITVVRQKAIQISTAKHVRSAVSNLAGMAIRYLVHLNYFIYIAAPLS